MFRGLLIAGLLVVAPGLAWAQQPCTTDARHVVDELYRHMLERSADASSQGWVDRLNSGTTVREIVRQIAQSPEHMQRFFNSSEGATASQNTIGTFYRHILGRQADQAGLQHFTTVANQQGLPAVVDAIVNSAEYTRAFGDWGVPGSGGVVFCGNGNSSSYSTSSGSVVNSGQMRFADLDRNRNGQIEKNEWRGSPRSFSIHDWNGDGVLSGDEVRTGAVPPADSLEAEDYNMSAADRFSYLDVNNNGFIDRNEWDGSLDAFYQLDRNGDNRIARAEMNQGGRRATFAALDANGDGRITLGEWSWSHRSFDQMDTNGDGVITPNEFRSGAVPTSGR